MRQAEHIELAIHPKPDHLTIHDWIYSEIRAAILSGRLKPDVRLPTTRDFALQNQVSRGSVVTAYEQLIAEGYLCSYTGRGTFVSKTLPHDLAVRPASRPSLSPKHGTLSRRGAMLAQSPFYQESRQTDPIPFRPNQPDVEHFPFNIWNRIASKRANALRDRNMGDLDPGGYLPLRESIAEHLKYAQRIQCTLEQVVILGSAQQALDLCTRLLLDVGDQVWMEDPGYPGANRIFAGNEAHVIPVAVDKAGMNVERAIEMAPHAKMAYITAAHQSPLGVTLSLERRLALLAWAEQNQATILEDDYDSEYRFDGIPLAPIKSLDSSGRVIYMGTFSKLLYPGIRLAYVVLPDWLTDPFLSAVSLTCRYLGLHPQMILSEFMAGGHYARHLRRMKMIYQERAQAFEYACREKLGGEFHVNPITTGLDACVFLPGELDDADVARQLSASGIEARPLSFYGIAKKPASGLVMGFAAFTPTAIAGGWEKIARILRQ
ncbi:PLP-dependent aminotransferase family protein [Methylobacillus arboreus]|uniref:MocR-like pyridoxine biosynthesis transcription factor PdxR n=1 Tax=Methylobacillus arboreus TaxID=755170 RepID=UPI001E29098D|nr:PLP-dependent aminotransferase family protein [Methylobacillus arboreus]MCB5191349.1 PLP-dependent aminotransferase family protein [Methylobacillus arboreus]